MHSKLNHLLEFGKFRLDTGKKVLWFEGEPVNLTLKEVELLCALAENSGEVVTKDELLQKVWADSFVEESNLSRHVYRLRKTFESYGEPDLIQTVPRRGYRFIGQINRGGAEDEQIVIERRTVSQTLIEELPDDSLAAEPLKITEGGALEKIGRISYAPSTGFFGKRNRLFLTGLTLLVFCLFGAVIYLRYRQPSGRLPLTEIKSVAVFPLQNLSGSENEKALALGLTDTLITKLGGLNRFTVRPLSATQKYSVAEYDALDFGKELKVDAVLEGSFQAAGERLRVNVRLLSVADGAQIWAGNFDEKETDIFKLQDLLSAQVAASLVERLTPQEERQLAARFTENLEAYKLYLKGRFFWNERSVEAYFKAIDAFEQAIALDPNFALGYSGIADCYALLEQRGGLPPNEAFPKAEEAARKALALDETLAEAHVSMALVKSLYRWEWPATETHLKRAIELNPNYAPAYGLYGMTLLTGKRFDEAEKLLKKAESIDPTSRSIAIYLAWKFYFAREFDEAIRQSRKALELDDSLTTPYMILRSAFEQKEMYDEAVEAELKRLRNYDPQTIEALKQAYQRSGIKAFWQKQVEVFRKQNISGAEVADYQIATRLALLGQNEEAIKEIEKGFVSRGSMWHQINVDPAFDPLRNNSRFEQLRRELDLN